MGRPLPDPAASQPPAKKFRPLGPTPLPPGPPTVQHLRILLESEHVDMNRPRQFFDYLRKRDDQPHRIALAPAEIKEILDRMKRVSDIWLRTMGEDEVCVQCIAAWLREFMKSPRPYEGIVSPAIWVGLLPLSFPISHPHPRPLSKTLGSGIHQSLFNYNILSRSDNVPTPRQLSRTRDAVQWTALPYILTLLHCRYAPTNRVHHVLCVEYSGGSGGTNHISILHTARWNTIMPNAEFQLIPKGHSKGQASTQSVEIITFRYIGSAMS